MTARFDSLAPPDPPRSSAREGAGPVAARPPLPHRHRGILSLDDFETAARRHLPRPFYGYIAGAAETNRSLHANRKPTEPRSSLPPKLKEEKKPSVSRLSLPRLLKTETTGDFLSSYPMDRIWFIWKRPACNMESHRRESSMQN